MPEFTKGLAAAWSKVTGELYCHTGYDTASEHKTTAALRLGPHLNFRVFSFIKSGHQKITGCVDLKFIGFVVFLFYLIANLIVFYQCEGTKGRRRAFKKQTHRLKRINFWLPGARMGAQG